MPDAFLDELRGVLERRRTAIAPGEVHVGFSPWDAVMVLAFVRRTRVHSAILHRATPEAQAHLAASATPTHSSPATPAPEGVAASEARTSWVGWGWKLLGY